MFENSLNFFKKSGEVSGDLTRGDIPFKSFFRGLAILALLFVVAIVAAANNYSLLGWSVVIIIALWLVMTTVTLLFVLRVVALMRSSELTVVGDAHLCPGATQCGIAELGKGELAADCADRAVPILREEKLKHNFEVIRMQSQMLLEQLEQDSDRTRWQAAQAINEAAVHGEELIEG